MSHKTIPCLICQSQNDVEENEEVLGNCKNCGMALSNQTPNSVGARKKRFLPFFWFVVVFCIVMVFFLPR